jgi:hypothetical protein
VASKWAAILRGLSLRGIAGSSLTIASGAAAATASSTAAGSSTSYTTGSVPGSRSPAARSGERLVAATSRPAATSCRTSGRPTAPVAPATNTFISTPPSDVADGEPGTVLGSRQLPGIGGGMAVSQGVETAVGAHLVGGLKAADAETAMRTAAPIR